MGGGGNVGEILNLCLGTGIILGNFVSYGPQVIKIVRRKSGEGISFLTFAMNNTSTFLNALSGIVLNFDILLSVLDYNIYDYLNVVASLTNLVVTWWFIFMILSCYTFYFLKNNGVFGNGGIPAKISHREPNEEQDEKSGQKGRIVDETAKVVKVGQNPEMEISINTQTEETENRSPGDVDRSINECAKPIGENENDNDPEKKMLLPTVPPEVPGKKNGNEGDGDSASKSSEVKERKRKGQVLVTIVGYTLFVYIFLISMFFSFFFLPYFGIFSVSQARRWRKLYGSILGYIASIVMFVTWLPQIITTLIHRKPGSFSIWMLAINTLGQLLAIIFYFFAKQSFAVWATSLANLIQQSVLSIEFLVFWAIRKIQKRIELKRLQEKVSRKSSFWW